MFERMTDPLREKRIKKTIDIRDLKILGLKMIYNPKKKIMEVYKDEKK